MERMEGRTCFNLQQPAISRPAKERPQGIYGDCEGGHKLMVTERTREDFEVVRRIFREADEGLDGAKRIAERLTREGVLPPTEGSHPRGFAPEAWRARNVHNILRNPVYCGHVVHQRAVVCRNAHEAAVDDATFARIQAKRKLRGQARQERKGNGANPLRNGLNGVLTPFLRCGTCGGRVTIVEGSKKEGQKTHLYFCGNRRESLSRCPGISVRVDKLDAVVLHTIEERVLDPENVATLIQETAEALAASDGDVSAAERERLTGVIAELDRKIRLTATHAINGMIDESDAKAITGPLVAQRDTARLQLQALPGKPETVDPSRVDPVAFRASVMEAWKNRPVEERREALAQVVDRVILKPGGVSIEYSLQHATGNCAHDRIGWKNRPCPQRREEIEVPEVRRPYTWARQGEENPAEGVSKSTQPPKVPKPPEGWRAREWRRMLDEGVYPHQSALARGEGVSAAAVSAGLKKLCASIAG